jgi:hypothetical protein
MATSFFGGSFFSGEFFNTPVTPASTGLADAGRASKARRRRVIIGDRLYEVDSLKDVDLLMKRVVRAEVAPVTKAAKARIRVVDRVTAKLDAEPAVALPMASVEVDWTALYEQLAVQDRAYADALIRAIARQEEDDLETILLLH